MNVVIEAAQEGTEDPEDMIVQIPRVIMIAKI
jgi:hypothetical protein